MGSRAVQEADGFFFLSFFEHVFFNVVLSLVFGDIHLLSGGAEKALADRHS